jgi:hypothetical protein
MPENTAPVATTVGEAFDDVLCCDNHDPLLLRWRNPVAGAKSYLRNLI